MALDHFLVEQLSDPVVRGENVLVRVTAKDALGVTDAAYVGTATFTCEDPLAVLPAPYTFLLADAGTKLFVVQYRTAGTFYLTVEDLFLVKQGRQQVTVLVAPLGYGFDPYAVSSYGAAASGLGSSLLSARAIATREVEVVVAYPVQDNSPYLQGDALNPVTWLVQRQDSGVYLNVVSVQQTGGNTYVLTTLEELGPVTVQHLVDGTALLDVSGTPITAPRQLTFQGLLDEDAASITAKLAASKKTTSDLSNLQVPNTEVFGGTLQITANGDYLTHSGADLLKKLISRRLMSAPGDFFHLPAYGIGLRQKEPVPAADLPKLKASIEQQVLLEPDVEAAAASVSFSAKDGVLVVNVSAKMRGAGGEVVVTLRAPGTGVVL